MPTDMLKSSTGRVSGFLWIEGVLLVLFGLAALVFPAMAGVATAVLLGWILIVCGIAGLVAAVSGRVHVQLWWSLVSAFLALVAGLIIAFDPLVGIAVLIGVVVAWLALDGISSLMIGLDLRRRGQPGWGWMIGSAVIDWILAAGAFVVGPLFGLVAIGIIIGVDLVLGGLALLTLASRLSRHVGKRP